MGQSGLSFMDIGAYGIIFYRYGAVLRIIVFKMSGRSQAFVEFHSPISAHVALLVLLITSLKRKRTSLEDSKNHKY
ncbi:hypothetical protein ACTXT7_001067 [Hymenolepis weldensis]